MRPGSHSSADDETFRKKRISCHSGLRLLVASLAVGVACTVSGQTPNVTSPNDQYFPGPDSQVQPDVPKGRTFEFTFDRSEVFPGTSRKVTVHVPAQYRGEKPACVYVALDGLRATQTVVFDNLINQREIPVLIGVGISPGTVPSASPPMNPRFNRSFEFDGLNGDLARLVLEEVLPEVERRKTPDGIPILLSNDPNDRCTGGASTGGIGAFTLCWERPDAFRRVFSAIGTFVGMRGGDRYPVLVRKTEPKPLRVFLQDGSLDQWMGGPEMGDWWMSNQAMERALRFAGYEVGHAWGEGAHDQRHADAVFPDAMRWLWKDWPQPVAAGQSGNLFLQAIVQPGEAWQALDGEHRAGSILAVDPQGDVFVHDPVAGKAWKMPGGEPVGSAALPNGSFATVAFGADGRCYASNETDATLGVSDATGRRAIIAEGIRARSLVVTHAGRVYATDSSEGKVWLISPAGGKVALDSGLDHPAGIALSPDGLWLAVAESGTHVGYSYRVQPDGAVQQKQKFYWFHVPDWANDSGAGSWCYDREGRLYSATRMGVQVFDRNGRTRAILPVPGGAVAGLCFGGANFDTLYVACAGKIYRRKLKVSGAPAWIAPIKLPAWSGG